MALPLYFLGAGVAALFAGNQMSKHYDKQRGVVGFFPGESTSRVKPESGSIVCCGIYELFEHSGVWVDNSIIELQGTGLVRGVSPSRFLKNRSGDAIFIACDSNGQPLKDDALALRAASNLYQYREYHVIHNNCNRFVAECLTDEVVNLTSFTDFNYLLNQHFKETIHWFVIDTPTS